MKQQQRFQDWLTYTKRKKNGDKLIPSTILCYVRTIENISTDMIRLGVIDKSLYNNTSIDALNSTTRAILGNNFFQNKNQRGHNRHTSALEHYIEFVCTEN